MKCKCKDNNQRVRRFFRVTAKVGFFPNWTIAYVKYCPVCGSGELPA
jgi:hypothetical protein